MPSLTKNIPKTDPLHARIKQMLEPRIKMANRSQSKQHAIWDKAENNVLAYVPESDLDNARKNVRDNQGRPKYTTIKLPYTYALLMTAHTYLTSVFFARSPVHQFTGRHGETEDQVQALEALLDYQGTVGEMLGPYYLWIYDALKYGVGIIEEYWDKQDISYAYIQDGESPDEQGVLQRQLVRVQTTGYEGNKIANVSPYDFFHDPRVPIGRFQDGEFVFIRKRLSWETVLRRKAQGYYMNIDQLSPQGVKDFAGTSTGNNSQLPRPEDNLVSWEMGSDAGSPQKHPAVVPVYEGCVTIVPKEWGLDNSEFPEKWMFTITADLSTLIGVQPHGAMHAKFPYSVLESEMEAYGTFNRGYPETAEGIQNTMDWLLNQHFFNVRAALNNQFLIDPSKVVTKDAEDGDAGFVYRLRPEAYGQDVRQFFHQIPVTDVTAGHVGDLQTMFQVSERVFGISDNMFGALSQGGRKTATEVRTSTGFGTNRLKTVSEYMSGVGFTQHSQRLVQNSQQYYSGELKFKIAGNLVTNMSKAAQQQFLTVNNEDIQGAYNFVPVDGTLPVDRLALANLWKELLLQMRTVPGLLQQYDLGRIFAHVAHLGGVRNLQQFKIEIGSPEALAQQADTGNLVPVPAGNNNATGVPSVGQTGSATAT